MRRTHKTSSRFPSSTGQKGTSGRPKGLGALLPDGRTIPVMTERCAALPAPDARDRGRPGQSAKTKVRQVSEIARPALARPENPNQELRPVPPADTALQ